MAEYHIIPTIDALAVETDAERAARLRERIALAIGNREALMRVLGDDAQFDNFYPDMEAPQLSTNDAIDAFLDRFGTPQETDLITRMIFDGSAARGAAAHPSVATPESTAAHQAPADATALRIDAFLAANPPTESTQPVAPPMPVTPAAKAPTPAEHKAPDTAPPTPALSETLASMMIKNGNYSKALEIISQLSLDMPKKSIYFADQIRFLRKLIANKERLESAK